MSSFPKHLVVTLAASALSLFAWTGCGGGGATAAATTTTASSQDASPGAEAHRLVEREGARLVDVRTADEFATGHLEGAVNIPVQEIEARAEELAPHDRPIVVYCASGARAARAAEALRRAGFTRVHSLGPMSNW